MKNRKKVILCILVALLLAGAVIGSYFQGRWAVQPPIQTDSSTQDDSSMSSSTPSTPPPKEQTESSSSGEPDATEYMADDLEFKRSDDWKQIVKDSPFQLGKPKAFPADDYYYFFEWNTYPHLDGSTVAIPMAMEFARQHLQFSDKNAASLPNFNTTHDAYELLIYKEVSYGGYYYLDDNHYESYHEPVDLIIATEPSDEELKLAKKAGVTLVTKPVCYDAFVFIIHQDNPIESLTLAQIQDIYTGKVTNWKEVGGLDAPIISYQREENSGSQTAMENLVMQGKPMIDAPRVKIDTMDGLVEVVTEYQNRLSSLGYTYKYYVDNFYPGAAIKAIAIEGIEPNEENIRSGTYPLSANYYGVIRAGEENDVGGKFLDWMFSAEGQACIAQAGYIPMDKVN